MTEGSRSGRDDGAGMDNGGGRARGARFSAAMTLVVRGNVEAGRWRCGADARVSTNGGEQGEQGQDGGRGTARHWDKLEIPGVRPQPPPQAASS